MSESPLVHEQGDQKVTFEKVRVGDIGTDRRVNTRPVDYGWVKRHVPVYDSSKLGVLEISRRDNGEQIFIDGQNRGALTIAVYGEDVIVPSFVHYGLSLDREAELFLGFQDRRRVKRIHEYYAKVTEEDPVALEIKAAVESYGWIISPFTGDNVIMAVHTLFRIYDGDKGRPNIRGEEPVWATMRTITETWGHDPYAGKSEILLGVGRMFNRFGDRINPIELTSKLSEEYTAKELMRDARNQAGNARGKVISDFVFSNVLDVWNKHRRAENRLFWPYV